MKFALRSTLLSALCCMLAWPAYADELTPAKKADIEKLLEINGATRIVEPFAASLTQGYMQSVGYCPGCSPKLPEVVRNETLAVMQEKLKGPNGLIERQAVVYSQHFSHAEIKQLLQFYNSAIGQKMINESVALTRENIGASQQWARDIAPIIKQRVDAALDKAGIRPPQSQSAPAR